MAILLRIDLYLWFDSLHGVASDGLCSFLATLQNSRSLPSSVWWQMPHMLAVVLTLPCGLHLLVALVLCKFVTCLVLWTVLWAWRICFLRDCNVLVVHLRTIFVGFPRIFECGLMYWKCCRRIYAAVFWSAFIFSIELGTLDWERFIWGWRLCLCVYGFMGPRSAGLPQYGQLGHGTDNEVVCCIEDLMGCIMPDRSNPWYWYE